VSQKSNPLKTAHISTCGCPCPQQTKIYSVICHSYPYPRTNFGSLISIFVRKATLFVTLTHEF